jgi:short-subunit dehydrogenase
MIKKALLTGFSSGIGFAYAKHLASKGWHLDLVSQNKERALSALEELDHDH